MWSFAVRLATADGPVVQVAGWVATVGAGLGVAVWIVRGTVRWLKRVDDFMDLVRGVPAQLGQPARPGVFERMDNHDRQLRVVATAVEGLRGELSLHVADRMAHAVAGAMTARRQSGE